MFSRFGELYNFYLFIQPGFLLITELRNQLISSMILYYAGHIYRQGYYKGYHLLHTHCVITNAISAVRL
jgi:hypothetical protein